MNEKECNLINFRALKTVNKYKIYFGLTLIVYFEFCISFLKKQKWLNKSKSPVFKCSNKKSGKFISGFFKY